MVKNINNIIITQCSGPIFQPNGLYYFLKTVCDGDRIKQKKKCTTWCGRYCVVCVCVCVYISFRARKKCIPKILLLQDQVYTHTKHVLNTLDGWRFLESDRKNVILGGGGGGGVGGGGSSQNRGGSSRLNAKIKIKI